ncbi:hypothetical protein Ancab_040050 [Ancistrocladus abbreviatus]
MASRMTRSKSVGGKGKAPMGASGSGTVPRAVAGRPGPFTSPQNAKWHEKYCHNTLVVEKTLSDQLNSIFDVRRSFRVLGWDAILTPGGEYCESLVRQFYANIEDKDRPKLQEICSVVKGVPIYITRDYLACLLRVANEGEPYVQLKQMVGSDLGFKLDRTLDRAGVRPSNRNGKWKIYTRDFRIHDRLIIYFFGYNVMPRASSGGNEARYANVYFLDTMRVGLERIRGIPFGTHYDLID